MKITCRRDCQVGGFGIVRRGQTIDLPPARVDARIAANFAQPDGKPVALPDGPAPSGAGAGGSPADDPAAAKAAEDALVKRTAALGRAQLTAAIEAAGATYSAKMNCEELARRLLAARGELA